VNYFERSSFTLILSVFGVDQKSDNFNFWEVLSILLLSNKIIWIP
jgi:hypothetical protein